MLSLKRLIQWDASPSPSALELPHAHFNSLEAELLERALARKEGALGIGGSFMTSTGDHTGRSPQDKFFVKSASSKNTIWWDNNGAMTPDAFATLKADMVAHINPQACFVQDLYAGADDQHRLNIRVITEMAWHSLFIRHMLRRPKAIELDDFKSDFTIIDCPSFKVDPNRHGCRSETVIAINMDEKMVLIGGTAYAGEIKKAVFTILNYLLPEKGVMPMHCSANHAPEDKNNSAIFFGLSGTGKTTLSADSDRMLIGDDEHGWSDDGIFNFEGGCYAKTINLNPQAEPEIYAVTRQFGTVIENMVFDPHTREPDFKDDSITANMRCAYPLEGIPNASKTGVAGHPKHVIMLTCDAFGVLPPIARLTPDQAIYHFLNGFTAKVAGTECGVTDPEPTFSTCFGAPFVPRQPRIYGDLLKKKIQKHESQCWLINTGWTGGPYGVGSRMPIRATRNLLKAVLDGSLNEVEYRIDDNFAFAVPKSVGGVPDVLLNPRQTWDDKSAYDAQAKKLVAMFENNYKQFK